MTIVSGILDVITFVHYRVFASKQTGKMKLFACEEVILATR